jgi:hypothetical protein
MHQPPPVAANPSKNNNSLGVIVESGMESELVSIIY